MVSRAKITLPSAHKLRINAPSFFSLLVPAKQNNAQKISEFLEQHPSVSCVIYPGLASHPQHELAKAQMKGFGGMVSFEIKGGEKAALAFLSRLKLFSLAESLGGVESLAEHPASMTHVSVSAEERKKIGITDSLVRLSVGIEHTGDLIADLGQALATA